MLDCALGLQYLHSVRYTTAIGFAIQSADRAESLQRGLVHGSLKPSNILVAEDGKACVADYGMAEIAPSGNTSSHRYYSPEAWKGVSENTSSVPSKSAKFTTQTISKPSDVFSFAMCSYEVCRLDDKPSKLRLTECPDFLFYSTLGRSWRRTHLSTRCPRRGTT